MLSQNIFGASGNEFLGWVQFARFAENQESRIRKKPSLNAGWLWSLVIRVRKLCESGSLQTDLNVDSLSFLTLITKLQSHSAFGLGFIWILYSGFWDLPKWQAVQLTFLAPCYYKYTGRYWQIFSKFGQRWAGYEENSQGSKEAVSQNLSNSSSGNYVPGLRPSWVARQKYALKMLKEGKITQKMQKEALMDKLENRNRLQCWFLKTF